jgi:hypothetical protein
MCYNSLANNNELLVYFVELTAGAMDVTLVKFMFLECMRTWVSIPDPTKIRRCALILKIQK